LAEEDKTMPPFWDLKGNDNVDPDDFLGTKKNRALIIKTNTDSAPANLEEVLRVTPSSASGRGRVGIGTTNPQRRLHVEDTEIHSGGSIAGLSFGNRETPQFVNGPGAGERWVWYASGGRARLWSGNDKVMVTPAGEVGIGTATPQRRLHVENTEIHSGGSIAGLSFGNRETPQFVNGPGAGERWVWYASGGIARLWSGNDKVTVTTGGTLTASTKNFRINHPLDPEHRLLIHACLEGPENAVYYRGQGRLEGGLARVELPDYFEALARPEGRTVILTSCCEENEPISVLAASGIVNGAFNVRAADDRNPQQPFYWEVKAVRADVEPLETEAHKAEDRSTTARGLASVGAAGG
jgi:hypothetical protein